MPQIRNQQLKPHQIILSKVMHVKGISQRSIADKMNCSQPHISRIISGKSLGFMHLIEQKFKKVKVIIIPKVNESEKFRNKRLIHEKLATKMTWNQVLKVREDYFNGKKTQCELAERFGVSQGYISKIVSGKKC